MNDVRKNTSLSFSDNSPRICSSSKNLPWYRCSKYSVILVRISRGSFRYAMYSSTCLTWIFEEKADCNSGKYAWRWNAQSCIHGCFQIAMGASIFAWFFSVENAPTFFNTSTMKRESSLGNSQSIHSLLPEAIVRYWLLANGKKPL